MAHLVHDDHARQSRRVLKLHLPSDYETRTFDPLFVAEEIFYDLTHMTLSCEWETDHPIDILYACGQELESLTISLMGKEGKTYIQTMESNIAKDISQQTSLSRLQVLHQSLVLFRSSAWCCFAKLIAFFVQVLKEFLYLAGGCRRCSK